MKRRTFLQTVSAQLALTSIAAPALAQEVVADNTNEAAPVRPFGFDTMQELARLRASAPYKHQKSELVGSFANLNYDSYRAIRFKREADPWLDHGRFAMDLLSPGLIFYEPVKINLVDEAGIVTPLPFRPELLDFDPSQFPDGADMETIGNMGWSGFRLRVPLNRPDVLDEFLVFQGASYFRAVARDTLYGLSARGLALNTGSSDGEEFPLFTDFWISRPPENSDTVVIYAMLDSKSVAGAFQFVITPGDETVIDTRVTLFPRVDLTDVGIAPLTSMFWFGPASRAGIDEYRPQVHDSDGLQMTTGHGQHLWRSLSLPAKLQISDFVDRDPRGFGLAQRSRKFEHFQDAEARYELRPSAWIEPKGPWGKGMVRLVEIPAENEFNDNIVSFWRPSAPLKTGESHDFSYMLTFAQLPPSPAPLAAVIQSRAGKAINDKDGRSYLIDFDLDLFRDKLPEAQVTSSAGSIKNIHVFALPKENILRLGFLFQPEKAFAADLQAVLKGPEGSLSETWMARWSK